MCRCKEWFGCPSQRGLGLGVHTDRRDAHAALQLAGQLVVSNATALKASLYESTVKYQHPASILRSIDA